MKKLAILSSAIIGMGSYAYSQITYSFSATSGAFTPLSSATTVHTAGTDDAISTSITLPFSFDYGCTTYTSCQISTNGVMFLGTTGAGSNLTNNLTGSTDRPAIAPLWDDLEVGTGGAVSYETSGTAPNRVFTVEWLNMQWNYSATNPVISFQVKLYETTNRIEFIYRQESGSVNNGSASIGISGPMNGDFYSLDNTGASPTASKTVETNTLNTKPATGQIYGWDPVQCSGTPSGYVANAVPSTSCSPYTTTLSLSGGSGGCGLTYQWESATNISGPYTSFATTPTATFNVTATTYFRCIITCTNSGLSMTTNTVSAVINASSPCVCGLIQIPSLPYNSGSATTCGMGDDVTSTNVTNVCGSIYYYTGEDAVYSFTPTTTGLITITLNSSGSYTGLMLYQGCPLSGGTCVAQSQSSTGSKTLSCISVVAGQAYFLVIDSWPPPTCNPYTLDISAVSPPITVSVTSNSVTCNGGNDGSATANVSGGTPGYTYTWSPIGGNSSTATGLTAGTYTVDIQDGNGCTATETVSISEPPALTINVTSNNVSCNGGNNGSATANVSGGTPGYTYTWSPSGGNGSTATGLTAQTYTVEVNDVNSCGPVSATVQITEPAPLTISITSNSVTCNGGMNGSATANVSGGTSPYSYTWSPSGGNGSTATGLTAGTYTVEVNDVNSCGPVSATVQITQPAPINTSVSVNGNTLTALQSGASYQWLDCNNSYATIPGATSQTYVASPGSYAVIITVGACSDTSACEVITSVSSFINNTLVKIYPNPANNLLYIEGVSTNSKITINDALGREIDVEMNRDTHVTSIDVSNLNEGIYILKVITNEGVIQNKLVIKHK